MVIASEILYWQGFPEMGYFFPMRQQFKRCAGETMCHAFAKHTIHIDEAEIISLQNDQKFSRGGGRGI